MLTCMNTLSTEARAYIIRLGTVTAAPCLRPHTAFAFFTPYFEGKKKKRKENKKKIKKEDEGLHS